MKKQVIRKSLTDDLIFKAVFGRNRPECRQALIALLNLILDRKDDPIVDITYKNPFSISEKDEDKMIIMDIRVETQGGELIDIEMQVEVELAYVNRSIFYGCSMLTEGLNRGENYARLKRSIVISFVKGRLFPDSENFHSVYRLYERDTHRQLADILELHYIELGKIEWRNKSPDELDELEQFGAYLYCAGDSKYETYVEELVQTKHEGVISMTDKVLKEVSQDEKLRENRLAREKFLVDQGLKMTAARDAGLKEGLEEGLKKAHCQQLETARKLKSRGFSIEDIIDITDLDPEEAESL